MLLQPPVNTEEEKGFSLPIISLPDWTNPLHIQVFLIEINKYLPLNLIELKIKTCYCEDLKLLSSLSPEVTSTAAVWLNSKYTSPVLSALHSVY